MGGRGTRGGRDGGSVGGREEIGWEGGQSEGGDRMGGRAE